MLWTAAVADPSHRPTDDDSQRRDEELADTSQCHRIIVRNVSTIITAIRTTDSDSCPDTQFDLQPLDQNLISRVRNVNSNFKTAYKITPFSENPNTRKIIPRILILLRECGEMIGDSRLSNRGRAKRPIGGRTCHRKHVEDG
ncbi:hypothetical protein L1887_38416 [Cichorium endivia]|nr:hypothetical protein L1887_38416 [Cichorium endivia]